MIDLDGIQLNGFESGTSRFQIDPEAGFEIGAGATDVQWVERRIGAIPLPDPRRKPIETQLPMLCHGRDSDEVLQAIGDLRLKIDKIEASAGLGGTEIGWEKIGATRASTLICFAVDISPVTITPDDERMYVGRFTLTITCGPYILGDWEVVASGKNPGGVAASDITVGDRRGDLPGPARWKITNRSTFPVRFSLLGGQWRDAVSGNEMLLPASTLDVSTPPLNGTYTAGTNQVQTLT